MRRYSRASDVWAYGVLVWEVMSRGQHPYSEFGMLTEVSGRVREGYRLQCPAGCDEGVYRMVMMPCWNEDASARPGFSSLLELLEDTFEVVGDSPEVVGDAYDSDDDGSGDTRTMKRRQHSSGPIGPQGSIEPALWASRDEADKWLLRGVSVKHLANVLAPKV